MLRILILLVLTGCGPQVEVLSHEAAIEGHYPQVEGLSGVPLRARLHELIKQNTRLTYNQVLAYLSTTDEDPKHPGNILTSYTDQSIKRNSNSGWNREHIWAKVRGFPRTDMPAFTDLHHIKPCEIDVNSTRSSMDFGEVEEGSSMPGFFGVKYNAKSKVFEPADRLKGDVARVMFYMDIRYEGDQAKESDLRLVETLPSGLRNGVDKLGNGYFANISTLIRWHKQDPVDDFERIRQEKVHKIQGNRNPFIDNPEWVEKVYGL